MYNDLENISSTIKKLSKKDWDKLFRLIPIIENTSNFAESGGLVKNPETPDSYTYHPVVEAKIVRDFERVLYDLDLLINFNWPGWDEGREIASKQNFSNQDTVTLLKLLSAFIRNNRFCDGALAANFKNGLIEKILKQIKTNIESMKQ